MSDNGTGSETTPTIARRNGTKVVEGGSISGDAHTPTLATSGTRSTGSGTENATRGRWTGARFAKDSPRAKHACYTLLTSCIENLDRAVDHDEDFFIRNNSIEHLKDALHELWKVRSQREEQFGEVVNLLEGILAGRNVEDFASDHLVCMRSVFCQLREEAAYDDNFANSITVDLLNGGLVVFRGID